MDLLSTGLLVAAVLAVIYGIKQISQAGADLLSFAFITVGVILGAVFWNRQQTIKDPLIDLSLFKDRIFTTSLSALTISLFTWSGIFLFVSQYLQLVLGLDAVKAGMLTIPSAAASIVVCSLAPVLARRIRRGTLMTIGLTVMAMGAGVLAFIGANDLAGLLTGSIVISLGCGTVVTLGIDMVVASAPPQSAGAASGISETSTTLGSALGIALLGSIWMAGYRARMDFGVPAGVSSQMREASRNTLGAAMSAAMQLGEPLGSVFVSTARTAFVRSMNLTAAVCAGVVLLLALFVGIRLRKVQ
jgi:DHA2 family multidrug resistance protein-like MFS transporter